jgi:hypothetical protein
MYFKAILVLALMAASSMAHASVLFFSGNLRTDANVIGCGTGCTLDGSSSDFDYAQWAAVVDSFVVSTPSFMTAITYGYGGGISQTGPVVPAGGLEPYLSLFDASGNFLASTYFGTTCPAGANSVGFNCFDVLLDGGLLQPGTYQIALTTYINQSLAENPGGYLLSDGFTGLGGLAGDENLSYAFDVNLNSISTDNVPEPATPALLAASLAVIFFRRKK